MGRHGQLLLHLRNDGRGDQGRVHLRVHALRRRESAYLPPPLVGPVLGMSFERSVIFSRLEASATFRRSDVGVFSSRCDSLATCQTLFSTVFWTSRFSSFFGNLFH